MLTQGDYRPGVSVDTAVGINYNNLYHVGPLDKLVPLFQIIGSHREADNGVAAHPTDTGYDRILLSPGVDITKVISDEHNTTFKLYGDVEIPVYQRANGQQLGLGLSSKNRVGLYILRMYKL